MEHSRCRDASIRSKLETTTLSRPFHCLDVNRSGPRDTFRSQWDMAGQPRPQPKIEDPGARTGSTPSHVANLLELKFLPRLRNRTPGRPPRTAAPRTAADPAVRGGLPGTAAPETGPQLPARRRGSGGNRGCSETDVPGADPAAGVGLPGAPPATARPARPRPRGELALVERPHWWRDRGPADPRATRPSPSSRGCSSAAPAGCRRAVGRRPGCCRPESPSRLRHLRTAAG